MSLYKILIVEDELIFAHEMELWLVEHGYEVSGIVSRGDKAVNSAISLHPDLVLMDIQLKGRMDGINAAIQIKKKEDIPIIFLTGNPDLENSEIKALIQPAAVIIKPVSQWKLLDTLKSVLK